LTSKVAVIGLGYVGLPLSVAAANSGFKVVGIDINQTQVTNINQGLSPIVDVSNEEISKLVKNGQFIATSEFSEIIPQITNQIFQVWKWLRKAFPHT
jgi:UDP-N-acetyl-D-glucosamine dehydrogenase